MTEIWDAGASEDLAERGRLVIDAAGRTIGIYRLDGRLYAYENVCPHQGGPVCQGLMVPRVLELLDAERAFAGNAFDETDLHIVCPWHGWEFSIRSGEHAAISDISLTKINVEESAGRITIAI